MGRIKSLMVKKAAKQLVASMPAFDESFDHNKKILRDSLPSKPIRNKVAGYIARMVKMKRIEQEKEAKKQSTPKPVELAAE